MMDGSVTVCFCASHSQRVATLLVTLKRRGNISVTVILGWLRGAVENHNCPSYFQISQKVKVNTRLWAIELELSSALVLIPRFSESLCLKLSHDKSIMFTISVQTQIQMVVFKGTQGLENSSFSCMLNRCWERYSAFVHVPQ